MSEPNKWVKAIMTLHGVAVLLLCLPLVLVGEVLGTFSAAFVWGWRSGFRMYIKILEGTPWK